MHLAQFPKPEEIFSEDPAKLLEEWKQIFNLRDRVMLVLEEARKEKRIGKGLEADVEIRFAGELLTELTVWRRYSESLKEILNVSKVTLIDDPSNKIIALPASGHKCARCWNFMPEVSNYGIWQNVCTRCHAALKEMKVPEPQPEAVQ
ncbi:MAG TPA: hypothetical protein VK720_14185 [Terracidiphilus sp.]|nr:hypothetical protein [Terracidiphilus sp.]